MTSKSQFRSNYKSLVAAMKDVTDLLIKLSSYSQKLEGFLFFVAPKIDFRQSRVPDFLSEEGEEEEKGEGDCGGVGGRVVCEDEGVREAA